MPSNAYETPTFFVKSVTNDNREGEMFGARYEVECTIPGETRDSKNTFRFFDTRNKFSVGDLLTLTLKSC